MNPVIGEPIRRPQKAVKDLANEKMLETLVIGIKQKIGNYEGINMNIIRDEVSKSLSEFDPIKMNFETFSKSVEESVFRRLGISMLDQRKMLNEEQLRRYNCMKSIIQQEDANIGLNPAAKIQRLKPNNNHENNLSNNRYAENVVTNSYKDSEIQSKSIEAKPIQNSDFSNRNSGNFISNANVNLPTSPSSPSYNLYKEYYNKKIDLNNINYSRFNYEHANFNNYGTENQTLKQKQLQLSSKGFNSLKAGNQQENRGNSPYHPFHKVKHRGLDIFAEPNITSAPDHHQHPSRQTNTLNSDLLTPFPSNMATNKRNEIEGVGINNRHSYQQKSNNTKLNQNDEISQNHINNSGIPIEEIFDKVKLANPVFRDETLKNNHIIKAYENKQKQYEDWFLIAKYNAEKYEEEQKERKRLEDEKKKMLKETLSKQIFDKQEEERMKKELQLRIYNESKYALQNLIEMNQVEDNTSINQRSNMRSNSYSFLPNTTVNANSGKDLLNDESKLFRERIEFLKKQKIEELRREQKERELKNEMRTLLEKQIKEKNNKERENEEMNRQYGSYLLQSVNKYNRDMQMNQLLDREKINTYKESLDRQVLDKKVNTEVEMINDRLKLINRPILSQIRDYYHIDR